MISLAVAAAGWVGSVHPEITPPSYFHHLRDTTKLGAWLITLVFSISYHSEPRRVFETLRTVQNCSFAVLIALVVFTVTRYGDAAYDISILHLGSIQNEPSASMFVLALYVSFFARTSRTRQLVGLFGLLLVVALLMKRSSLMAALVLLVVGTPFITRSKVASRVLTWFAVPAGLLIAASFIDFQGLIHGSGIIAARLEDFQKLQLYHDIRYLGSGRLGLLQDHWNAYMQGSVFEHLFGRLFTSPAQVTAGGYLGSKLFAAPHNDAMEMIVRGGLFGLLTYLLLLVLIGLRLTVLARRPKDLRLAAARFVGIAAGLVYVLHIFIGVIFKVQFMIVISILVGMAIRIGYEERRSRREPDSRALRKD